MRHAWLAQILTQRDKSGSCQSDRNGTNFLLRRGMQSASPRHPSQFNDQPYWTWCSSPRGPLHILVQCPLHGRSHWRIQSPLFQWSNAACMLTVISEADYVQKRGSWKAALLDALISFDTKPIFEIGLYDFRSKVSWFSFLRIALWCCWFIGELKTSFHY